MPVTINGTSGVTTPSVDAAAGNADLTTLSVAGNEISAVNSLGFRNRIINGDMRIDQRNAGASVTPTNAAYAIDRFVNNLTQASKFSVQQSTTAPAGFSNSMLVTSLSAYSITSTDNFQFEQRVEGFNFADMAWGTASASAVTLSFWVRSSLTGTFGGSLRNNSGDRSYPFTYSISAANTWEQKTVTIAGDTTGTWVGGTNGIAVRVGFSLGTGSTLSGTAGAWAGANYLSATGATSVVGTNGATFYITGVQLEAGSVASPFERRDYGRELMMCQRYYQQIGDGGGTLTIGMAVYDAGNGIRFAYTVVPTPVAFRAQPTITATSPSATGYTIGAGSMQVGGSVSLGAITFAVTSSSTTQSVFQATKLTMSSEL